MEDRHKALLELPKNKHIAYFGVYDGHAGLKHISFHCELERERLDDMCTHFV